MIEKMGNTRTKKLATAINVACQVEGFLFSFYKVESKKSNRILLWAQEKNGGDKQH